MAQILLDNPTRGSTTLLTSCVPSTTSSQLADGTTPDDHTGDNAFNGSRKIKQWMVDQNAMNTELYGGVIFVSPSGSAATDDANIAAAFATMAATSGNQVLMLAPGQYYSQQKNVFTFAGTGQTNFWFIGNGAIINQNTNNVGIWEFQSPGTAGNAGLFFKGITWQYSAQQTSSNTAAVCLGFRSTLSTDPNSNGLWHIFIDQCNCRLGYRGIANTQPVGHFPVWDIHISNCITGGLSGAAAYLSSPIATGAPNISIENCEFGTFYLGGSESLVVVTACDNLVLSCIEFLSVTAQSLFFLSSVAQSNINNCKCEGYVASGSATPIISLADGACTITGFRLNGLIIAGTARLISMGATTIGSCVTVNNLSMSVASGTGTLTCFNGGSTVLFNVVGLPAVKSLGSGPATINLVDNGTATPNSLNVLAYQGGEMSDDMANTSMTFVGYVPGNVVGASSRVNVWNSMTVAQTLTLSNSAPYTNNLWDGAECHWIVTANCIANLTVSLQVPPSKIATPGTWGKAR